jgi:HlyD family secretion protein
MAATALKVTQRNYALTRAGAWRYDIANQQHQLEAASKARDAAQATLDKFIIRAPIDGVVLSLNATVGSYATPQGAYDPRTQATVPVATIGTPQARLAVRAYVDEILVQRLPRSGTIRGVMTVLGSSERIPLHFERIQPYVSPKIELSNQRQERVDVRVLPLVFSFTPPRDMRVYPGELVDVYIGAGK